MHHNGRFLRRMRQLRGMKQGHLAECLGVDQTTVSRWERGTLPIAPDRWRVAESLLAERPDPAQDAALKRLVVSSRHKVHLICDRTHRLLAASPARQGEWGARPADFLGRSLIVFASPEILAAEGALERSGWHEGAMNWTTVETGPNDDPVFHILPGRMLWERLVLSDGTPARLVTTLE